MLLVSPGKKVSVRMVPNTPMGTANNTEKGTDQLSYSAARKRNTNTMEIANTIDVVLPDFISSLLIPENSYPYPAGSTSSAVSLSAVIASPLLNPAFALPLISIDLYTL